MFNRGFSKEYANVSLCVQLWILKLYIFYIMYIGTIIHIYKYKRTFLPLLKHRRLLGVMGKLEDIGKSCWGKKSIFSSDWKVKKGNSSHFVVLSYHALKWPALLKSLCGFLLCYPPFVHRAFSSGGLCMTASL